MALPWIKLYGDLPGHRKSVTLAALTGDPRAWTHVVELWIWVSRHAPTGDLSGMPDAAIAAVAGWRGDAVQFVDALRQSGFLSGAAVHGWCEHNGAHHRKSSADKARNERRRGDSQVENKSLTSESLVNRQPLTTVESRDSRIEKEEKDLALFDSRKGAGWEPGPGMKAWLPTPEDAAKWLGPVVESYRKTMEVPLAPVTPAAQPAKPRRGRPPKDRSPEAEAERKAEREDGERWIAAARSLIGLDAQQAPWSAATFMAFRQARRKRGIDQLLASLDALAGDAWARRQGLAVLLSATVIEKGLAMSAQRGRRMGTGINAEWDQILADGGSK